MTLQEEIFEGVLKLGDGGVGEKGVESACGNGRGRVGKDGEELLRKETAMEDI